MAFDPNKPFDVVEEEVVGFDPNLPFEEVVDEGTSFTKEIQQIGPAFMESLGRPLESMGETAEVFGFTDIAEGLKGAITEPENYESAAARFAEPKPEDASFLGFAWQYAPRAIAEQTGQIGLTMGGSIAGRAAGIPFGPVGTAVGSFLGPAIIEAAQIIGPVAKERAANNGRKVPNQSDIAGAILTATGSGALNAIGAKYLPGGEKAAGKFFKRVATSFIGEGTTETGSAFVEQVGGTAFTEKGLEVSPKQAIAEGIIGGGSGAAITAISAPLHREPKEKKIVTEEEAEEQDIEGQSNIEAINLTAPAGDIQTKKDVSRIAELEKVKAENEILSQALEPNEPEAKRLDLENAAIDKEIKRLQGSVIEGAGLTPVTKAEEEAVAASKEETPTAIATRIEQIKVNMAGVDPASRRYAQLQEELSTEEGKLVEQQQAELATAIAEEPVSATITPVVSEERAQVSEITPAPTIREEPQVSPMIGAGPTQPTPAEAPAPEVAKPTGGVDYYKQLGEQDALDINRKKKRSVPQNFKLAYENGWSAAKRKAREEAPTPAVSETITEPAEVAPTEIEAIHYSRTPMKLEKGVDVSKIEDAYEEESTFGRGFYAMEPADESFWAKGMIGFSVGDFRNEVKISPKNPIVISPETIKKLGYDAIKDRIDRGDYDAIISRGWDEDFTDELEKRINELWEPKFENEETSARFTNIEEYKAAQKQAIEEITGYTAYDWIKLNEENWNQNQIYIPPDIAPDIVSTPTAPAGPAVGNRIKLGRSPQTYVIEEVIPQSEAEKANGEQFYSVKNEKTGKVQTVEAKDLKLVKGKGARKMAAQTQDSRFADLERRAKAGDKEAEAEAQRMVDDAAKEAGYDIGPVWHGSPDFVGNEFNLNMRGRRGLSRGGFSFTRDRNAAEAYMQSGVDPSQKMVDEANALMRELQSRINAGLEWSGPYNEETVPEFRSDATDDIDALQGYIGEMASTLPSDLQTAANEIATRQSPENFSPNPRLIRAFLKDPKVIDVSGRELLLAESPTQIKSADPFTYDDAGKLIPLSERFQPTTPDIRRMADIKVTEEVVKPVPKDKQYTFEEIERRVKKYFGGTIPEDVVIVNDTTEDYEFKGAYIIDNGQLIINQAYIRKGESISDIISHELGHYMYGDPEFQTAFKNFWDALTPAERAEIDRIINEFYNKDTGEVQLEERRVLAFEQLIENSKARSAWRKLVDAIGNWINKTFGTKIKTTDAGAMAVLAAGHKRFKSGEKIVREMEGMRAMKRYDKKSQVAGIKNIGSVIDTPKGIKKTTEKIIKDRFLNVDEVSEANTAKAWNLIGKLQKSNSESEQTVSAINEFVRETIQDTEADDVVKQTIGGAIMRNELYKYAIKLTAQGDNKMLNYLLNNRLAIASGAIDEGDAGRMLNALANLKNWIVRASDSEQSAFTQIAASRFFNTKTPTDEQIKQIKAMFDAVKTTKIDQEKELSAELEEVGKATGIDVAQKVVEAVESSVATRDPWIVAFEILRRELGEPLAGFAFKPLTMAEAIKKALIPKLANYQKSMVQQGAKGLEATFWKTMSDQEKKPGPLAEVDAAINRNLAAIVKDTLIKLGLKGKPDNTKMTLIEQVANILTNQKLTQEKMVLADKRVLEEINRREGEAIERAGEDQDAIDAAEAEAQALRDAWNEAMGQQMNLPVSEATLGRLINNEMKEAGTKLSEIETLSELEPAIADSRKQSIVNSIINKLYGIVLVPTDRKPITKEELAALDKQVFELEAELANDKKREASQSTIDARKKELKAAIERRDAEKKRNEIPKRDYDLLSKALSDKFNQMLEARKLKSRVAKAARDAKADLNNPDKQAESQIKRLAKIQSDTQEWATSKKDEVKAIVQNDLRNTPDMGRKEPWKAMLVGQLKQAGVSDTQAGILADLVWNQHEKNALSREMDALNKAVEKGPIKGIVDAILNTPLAEQQKPEWRKEVIKKYLIDAGVASTKADNIAKLFDISLQKRFAEAQVKAAEKAMKGIGGKLTPESKRAFQAFIKAIRAQVVNPGTDAAKEFGKQMGWKGFTPEQVAKINEYDSIIESDTTTEAEKYVAIKKIQDIVASVSLPPTALSAFSSFYVGNALGRITTASIQVVDPALYTAFDTAVDAVRMAATNPAQVPFAIYNYFASLHRMMKEIAFSFRNDINRSGKMVDYLDNNDAKITRVFQDGQRLWKQGQYKEGLKKMLFGYPAITFRTLKALDDGSFSLLREAAITRYVSAAMDMAKVPKKDQRGVIRGLMQGREMDIKQMVAQGLSKTDATVYANDRMMKEITNTLSGLNIEPEDTINSIINDSLSRLGKTRFMDDITGEGSEIKDKGTISWPFIKFYELTSRGVSNIKGPGGEAMRVFQRVLFGFPLIPARMFNIAAGYTPLTLYRHFLTGRYPLTYGTAMQRKQRLIEQMSGVLALAPFLLLRSMSLDDDEEKGVRVYFTGQGPLKSLDKTLHQQWNRKHKPFSMEVFIGDKKIALDAKASGPFSVLIYTMGAIDDWQIRNRIKNKKIEEGDWRAVEEKLNFTTALYELSGYALLTYSRRGPTTAVMQGAVDFRRYPDDPIASIGSELSFSAIPAVPVLGMGVVKNVSDLLSEPIDTTTIKGALLNNIPIVGPLATKPAINTFGQKVGELQVSEKLKKATGIPFTLTNYSNPEEQKLANITMKYGDGPEPIKRSWLEDQFESMITDEEWYAGAEAFGKANRQMVLEDYDYLNDLTNEEYRDEMKAIAKVAREEAYDAVDKLRSKTLTRPQR